ncbi:hypothetical protein [Antrihabitans sp. YC2-6]|uniref:hypothetical protein n=1 Tax=Antrihabitans sp. YC2-6 TaxID=2799498 RepID=UPI0018F611E5|nr:hypothetical protein [Antrihabitans sp. YC2-6]MBJ8348717.1 hypothetical protein [Antrihabitans sp. YC2-6]
MTETLAHRIAAAALDVDGVTGLHGGLYGEVATYLPGERISGVLVGAAGGEVHVVTDLRRNIWTVAEEVRAVAEKIAGVPIVVTVEDVVVEDAVSKAAAAIDETVTEQE